MTLTEAEAKSPPTFHTLINQLITPYGLSKECIGGAYDGI